MASVSRADPFLLPHLVLGRSSICADCCMEWSNYCFLSTIQSSLSSFTSVAITWSSRNTTQPREGPTDLTRNVAGSSEKKKLFWSWSHHPERLASHSTLLLYTHICPVMCTTCSSGRMSQMIPLYIPSSPAIILVYISHTVLKVVLFWHCSIVLEAIKQQIIEPGVTGRVCSKPGCK